VHLSSAGWGILRENQTRPMLRNRRRRETGWVPRLKAVRPGPRRAVSGCITGPPRNRRVSTLNLVLTTHPRVFRTLSPARRQGDPQRRPIETSLVTESSLVQISALPRVRQDNQRVTLGRGNGPAGRPFRSVRESRDGLPYWSYRITSSTVSGVACSLGAQGRGHGSPCRDPAIWT
jgi:hypothetical protein